MSKIVLALLTVLFFIRCTKEDKKSTTDFGAQGITINETGFEIGADESPYTQSSWEADGFEAPWVQGFNQDRAHIDKEQAHTGNSSLRIDYPENTYLPFDNGAQVPLMFTPREEVFISYWIRFSENFDWGGDNEGGKIPGLAGGDLCSGGSSCDGTNGFSARLMWRPGGKAVLYLYHMDNPYFSSYGVHILGGGASYNLIENNIFDWFRHSMVIQEFDNSEPKNNVFGYNYCGVTFTADGTHFSATTTMEFHNNSVFYNLVEGNVVEQVGFQSDGHHYNTIFRNRINNGGVSLGYSNYCIGNEFTEIKNPGYSMSEYGNSPRGYYGDYIVHGNYVTDPPEGLLWDPSIPEHNLPNSCYLSRKPDWFGDLEWPPYGGDLMPGNTRQNPAEVRYWAAGCREVVILRYFQRQT